MTESHDTPSIICTKGKVSQFIFRVILEEELKKKRKEKIEKTKDETFLYENRTYIVIKVITKTKRNSFQLQ